MIEFRNKNLERAEPEYFYQVSEFVTTFEKDANKTKSFSHKEIFKDNDLLKARKEAMEYYNQRLQGFDNTSYVLPFASPADYETSKNAAFSISLSLVEFYNDDELYIYPIAGEDDETVLENKESERLVLADKGYEVNF